MYKPQDVIAWHQYNGGAFHRPASHGVRLLGEVLELCFALGASTEEVEAMVAAEVAKAIERKEPGQYNPTKVFDEVGDVGILFDLLTQYLKVNPDTAKEEKLEIISEREWEADIDGVLFRPDRIPPGRRRTAP